MVKRIAKSEFYGTTSERISKFIGDIGIIVSEIFASDLFKKYIAPMAVESVVHYVENTMQKNKYKIELKTQLSKNELMEAVFTERFNDLKLEEKEIKNLALKTKVGISKARMKILQSCSDNIHRLSPEWLGYAIAVSLNENSGNLNLDKELLSFFDNFSTKQKEEILNDLKDQYAHSKWQRERTRRQADNSDFEEL